MDISIVKKYAIDVLVAMNAAITSARLYPPGSALIATSIQRLYLIFAAIFEHVDSVVYSESERSLLIQSDPLSEKEQKRPQVLSFISLMLDLGIRSISISKGLSEKEIAGFVQIMVKTADEVKAAGGIGRLLEKLNVTHFKIDEQIYFKMDEEQRAVAETVLSSFQDMSEEELLAVLTGEKAKTFDENGFMEFVNNLNKKELTALAQKTKKTSETVAAEDTYSSVQKQFVERIFELVTNAEKSRSDIEKQAVSAVQKETESQQQLKIENLKTAMNSLLTGKVMAFPEIATVEGLAGMVEKMVRQGKKSMADTIIENLGEALKHDDPEIRAAAANIMAGIDEKFEASDDFLEERLALSRKLSQWIQQETVVSAVFEKVTDQLKKLSQTLIGNEQAEAAEHILEAYHQMATGNLKKDEAIRSLAENMLGHLATEEILDMLLKDERPDGSAKKKENIYSLILLGTTTVEMLLDRLHDSHNRSERNRIIQVITKIGKTAELPVLERLGQSGPWFYIRNLVLLMGKIGTGDHLEALEPMLIYEDSRVQREAVVAIQSIGGQQVAEIILRKLFAVEDETKMIMISVLGLLKSERAVPDLIKIIETRTLGKTKKTKNSILIKACEALGRIRDDIAEPALKKIASSKGFLSILSHDSEVRTAAKEALASLKKK